MFPRIFLLQGVIWIPLAVLKGEIRNYFLLILILVVISVFLFSYYYVRLEKRFLYFSLLVFGFVLSIVFLIIIDRWFFIFLGWDGLGITSFLLVGFYQNWKTNNNRILTFLRNRIGDGLFLLFFARILFFKEFNSYYIFLGGGLIILALIRFTKRAQFPLSRWLPAAMAAPTPVSALVHSSTLVTAGIVLLIKRINNNVSFNTLLLRAGLLTILIASLVALEEKDFKKLVALSTLSQLGFIFVSLRMNLIILTLFHLVSHAFFKRLLFIRVGGTLHTEKSQQDGRGYLQAFSSSLIMRIVIQVCLLSLRGIFFLRGFFSKDLFLEIVLRGAKKKAFTLVFLLRVSLTLFYRLRIFIMAAKTIPSLKEKNESLFLILSVFLLFFLSIGSSFLFLKNMFITPEIFLFFEKGRALTFLVLVIRLFIFIPFFKNKYLWAILSLNYLFYNKIIPKGLFIHEKSRLERLNFTIEGNLKLFYHYLSFLFNQKHLFILFFLRLFLVSLIS